MLLQLRDVISAGATVIPFAARAARTGLSVRDRMEIATWQDRLRPLGVDRVVIHERGPCDPPDVDSFLCIYRRGEAWARWGLARCGGNVLAWCCVTGADIGRFGSIGDALLSLFPAASVSMDIRPSADIVVYAFAARQAARTEAFA